MKEELVSEWMTREVITITPDTTLKEAHDIMNAKSIRRLPVVNHGKLVGIVTLGDIRGAEPSRASSLSIWEVYHLLAKLKVAEIMTRDPITIHENASMVEAARIMLEKKIGGLPVLGQEHQLLGIISESDIFRFVASQ